MPEESAKEIIHRIIHAVEAMAWLHDEVTSVLAKLNEDVLDGISFSAFLDNQGRLHVRCRRDLQSEQSGNVMPLYLVEAPTITLGCFAVEEQGDVFFIFGDHYGERAGGQAEIRECEDVSRALEKAILYHWNELFGLFSQVLYSSQYEAIADPEAPLTQMDEVEVEEIEIDPPNGPLGSRPDLIMEPLVNEW